MAIGLIKSFVHLVFSYELIYMALIIISNTFITLSILDIMFYVTFIDWRSMSCMLMWIELLWLGVIVKSRICRILIHWTIIISSYHTIINSKLFNFFLCIIDIVMSIRIRIGFWFLSRSRSWLVILT